MIRRFIKYARSTETKMVEWKARNGLDILRVSLAIVFIWFGMLKFFPGLSSAEIIAGKTILKLTFGHVPPQISLPILACCECAIGLGLLLKKRLSYTLLLLYFQMAGTMLPLFFFPHETFNTSILAPTLLGQYIIKNLVLLSSAVVIGATVQGGAIIANAAVASKAVITQSLVTRYRRRFNEEPILKSKV